VAVNIYTNRRWRFLTTWLCHRGAFAYYVNFCWLVYWFGLRCYRYRLHHYNYHLNGGHGDNAVALRWRCTWRRMPLRACEHHPFRQAFPASGGAFPAHNACGLLPLL